MRYEVFLKRLNKEMPAWIEKGWLTQENSAKIAEHAASQESGHGNKLTLALALLGVILLGAGVIMFFASNWQAIPKLGKLALLFGALWGAFGLAAYWLSAKRSPMLGEAMVLLGVIMFGANIHLIAQIYHIDAHYPDGVLLWSVGALLAAYLLNSQAALIAALALALLWSAMEHWGFNRAFHWPFLLFWCAALPLQYRHQAWQRALWAAGVSVLVWSFFCLFREIGMHNDMNPVRLFMLAYTAAFIGGLVAATYPATDFFSRTLKRCAAIGGLFSFYLLTTPKQNMFFSSIRSEMGTSMLSGWGVGMLFLLALAIGLALWHRSRVKPGQQLPYLNYGRILLAFVLALTTVNFFMRGVTDNSLAVIVYNILFFATLIWVIHAGLHANDRYLVNLGFLFFSITVVSRYFDTFWSLFNRSLFFMGGGLLLLGGGYLLERQRRKLNASIQARRAA
ncbi:MAG: DUF2157 domain-containing protein [Burkholderiales bacterium]